MCIYVAPGSVSVITLVYLSMISPDGDLWITEKFFIALKNAAFLYFFLSSSFFLLQKWTARFLVQDMICKVLICAIIL